MTIKVIKQGKLPEEVEYQFTCNKCKTSFTATIKDGRLVYDQRDGDFVLVACPTCNTRCSSSLVKK